jgi:predicted DNA-binding transcriptional regulator YafY
MNRIDRLAAILIQLQSRPLVKAQDIATKFSISLRTVYRDVKALEEAGVPVIGEAGTGYRLMEGYKLPPVMFNMDEATALLTASKLVQSKTDAGISKHYIAALDKIRAILRHSEKDHIEEIDDHIAGDDTSFHCLSANNRVAFAINIKSDRQFFCYRNKLYFS